MSMDKNALRAELLRQIRADLENVTRSQLDTQAAATHAENRAEHAKDTRATEQGYLARGLAERVEALHRSEERLAGLPIRSFEPDDEIGLSAIVRIDGEDFDAPQSWWLVPAAGGLELDWEGETIRTLSPTAPLGRALLGLQVGDEGRFETPGGARRFEILDVR